MVAISDARKAYRMLRGAVSQRAAAGRVRARAPQLEGGRFRIAVYFADGAANAYQLRQWYGPLQRLSERWPVLVLARAASAAEVLLQDGVLPVAFVPKVPDLEEQIAAQDIRVVLYVNQNARNFQMFRYGGCWHVFIGHGESDKAYMSSNQYKAYDYALVAGQAARDRLARALWDYDVGRRTIMIGRPQTDHVGAEPPYRADERTVVLYAPTWEGSGASKGYGSVVSHGERLVEALLATGRHRVIYRPHPRIGSADRAHRAAHRRIVAALAAANASDPGASHVLDDAPQVGWQIVSADVAVVDVSAMVYDRLAVGRPLLVTRPVDPEAVIDGDGYLGDCEWLTAEAARDVVTEVDRVRDDAAAAGRLRRWVEYYYGDTTPGVATARFHAAIERLMAEWEGARLAEQEEARRGD